MTISASADEPANRRHQPIPSRPWWLALARACSLAWKILGLAILLFALVNLVAWGRIDQTTVPESIVEAARTSLATDDRALAEDYARELSTTATNFHRGGALRWEPFSYWRSEPFTGKYIQIDAAGRRRTVARAPIEPGSPRVVLYGGSTAWGFGARDEHTIASCLAKLLHEDGVAVEVVNAAQIGYVSTQELIEFQRNCAAGDVPDLVVFLTGVNDLGAAAQSGQAGLSINEANRAAEFNVLNDGAARRLFTGLVRQLPIVQLLTQDGGRPWDESDEARSRWSKKVEQLTDAPEFEARWKASLASEPLQPGETPQIRLSRLVQQDACRQALTRLGKNADMSAAIAQRFGTQTLWFWQPTVFDRKRPTAPEQEIAKREALLRPYFVEATQTVRSTAVDRTASTGGRETARLHDLSGTFEGDAWKDKTAYIDLCHVTEEANLAIARAMLPLVLAALQESTSPAAN